MKKRSTSQKSLGGRPLQIDNGPLFNRRDSLIQILSAAWGDIGWDLERVSTPQQLSEIFNRLNEKFSEEYVRLFRRQATTTASASDIRSTKKALGNVVRRMYELTPELNAQGDRLAESGYALVSTSNGALEVMLDETFNCLASFRTLRSEMDRIEREVKDLEAKQADQEASYSQNELLRFINVGKYAHNPRNLAQAMAGLPKIGCWQSFQRCEKQPSPLWPTRPEETPPLSYQVFEIIAECWDHRDREPEKAFLNLLRERIRTMPESNLLRSHLTEHWRYLRQAVEQIDLKQTVSGAVPFRVFGQFRKSLSQPRSSEENVLATREQRDLEGGSER